MTPFTTLPVPTSDPLPYSKRRRNLGTPVEPEYQQGDGSHMTLCVGEHTCVVLPYWLKRLMGLFFPTMIKLTVPEPLPSYPLTLCLSH